MGCRGGHILPAALRNLLADRGYHYLADIELLGASTLWQQGWISAQSIAIPDDLIGAWEEYIRNLSYSHIRLTNRCDELIWEHHPSGRYTPKHGYIQLNVNIHNRDLVWWWKHLWTLKCPGKAKLLAWAILENKAPTWDILQKRFIQGPGYCPLCKEAAETSSHIFVHCRFTQAVWADICKHLELNVNWWGMDFHEAFQLWWTDHKLSMFRAVPCILAWGIWITRNKIIFQDSRVPLEQVVAQAVGYNSIQANYQSDTHQNCELGKN